MTDRNPFWIQTHTPGTRFDLAEPRAEDVRIEDIAYALSKLCRFTGHCKRFYSVAQHSIHVAEIVAETHPEWALAALLHDAEEAYIGDISSPLKALIRNNGGARLLEGIVANVEFAIEDRFGLFDSKTGPYRARRDCIKAADLKMLATERRELMPTPPADGADWFAATGVPGVEPCEWRIRNLPGCLGSEDMTGAMQQFMYRFEQYGGKS
jgi:5'-nucleotidase